MSESVTELVEAFLDACLQRAAFAEKDDYRKANVQVDRMHNAFVKLHKLHGQVGYDALRPLADDPNPNVAHFATFYLLGAGAFVSEMVAKLEQSLQLGDFIGLEASEVLKRWRNKEPIVALEEEKPKPRKKPRRPRHPADPEKRSAKISEIVEPDRLDERMTGVPLIASSVIGFTEDEAQWCPDHEPPTYRERIAWTWIVRPDLVDEKDPKLPKRFREEIRAYREGPPSE